MKSILVHPTYFPSIVQMVAIVQASNVIFEIADNYQKQTYRNRAYIAHSNGKLLLNIPIKHNKTGVRLKTNDVLVENSLRWQSRHWKSLQYAYRTSPFFEYYEEEFQPLFTMPVRSLIEFNMNTLKVLCECMGVTLNITKTKYYEPDPSVFDLRFLVVAKTERIYPLIPYTQVLESKHGFLSNLSVLDLLFNEGPNTLNYLESQKLDFN